LDVTGIDNSRFAIRICKERKLKKAINISIEQIGKFRKGSFDTIIMFGNNFGLFGSFKKAKVLLKKMHRITSKNAIIITENVEPYKTTDIAHISYHKFNKKRGRIAGQLRIRIRFRQYIRNWFDYLLVSQKEMKDILKGTGWKVKRFINSNNYMYTAIIEKE
jgi:hypothetical protein